MKYLCESYTHVGGRGNNEDAMTVLGGPNGILLVVADGLGGHDCGEVASSTAVSVIREEFAGEAFDPVAAIKLANKRIIEKQVETGLEMKTTVCVAWIKDGTAQLSHVGDSRIYAFKDGEVSFQSVDHSASQMAVTVGEITPAEIRHHPDRNVLVRALGVGEEVKVDTSTVGPEAYDALLLCTDGFWEYVLEEEMCLHLKASATPDEWIGVMREILAGRVPAGHDNNTAVALIKGE